MCVHQIFTSLARIFRIMAFACFVVMWLLVATHHGLLMLAGGRPYRHDAEAHRYFVKQKSTVTEVDQRTYERLVVVVDIYERYLLVPAFASIAFVAAWGVATLLAGAARPRDANATEPGSPPSLDAP